MQFLWRRTSCVGGDLEPSAPVGIESLESRRLLSAGAATVAKPMDVRAAPSDLAVHIQPHHAEDDDGDDVGERGQPVAPAPQPTVTTVVMSQVRGGPVISGAPESRSWLKAGSGPTGAAAVAVAPVVGATPLPAPVTIHRPGGMGSWFAKVASAAVALPVQATAVEVAEVAPSVAMTGQALAAVGNAAASLVTGEGAAIVGFASVSTTVTFHDALAHFMDECANLGPGLVGQAGLTHHGRAWMATAVTAVVDVGVAAYLIRRARRRGQAAGALEVKG